MKGNDKVYDSRYEDEKDLAKLYKEENDLVKEFMEYRDLKEKGRIVILPEIGQAMYEINNDCDNCSDINISARYCASCRKYSVIPFRVERIDMNLLDGLLLRKDIFFNKDDADIKLRDRRRKDANK